MHEKVPLLQRGLQVGRLDGAAEGQLSLGKNWGPEITSQGPGSAVYHCITLHSSQLSWNIFSFYLK